MPYDLSAIERGYGECDVNWTDPNGQPVSILVRYRADINNRALIAMKRVMVGVLTLDGTTRFPDVEAIIEELIRVLLPSGPDVPEEERGWDVTRGDESLPITFDTLVDLAPGLPAAILAGVATDVNNPDRRRPSRRTSGPEGGSAPEASPTTSSSSKTLNGQASLPGPSPALTTLPAGSVGASSFG